MTSRIEEPISQFELRKAAHIKAALNPDNEAFGQTGLDRISLSHEALPDLDFDEITIATPSLNQQLTSPFFISSMTAGHPGGVNVNHTLMTAAAESGWLMGVGSQRRELFDDKAPEEWRQLRTQAPNVKLLGNIGISQAIVTKTADIQRLVDSLEAVGLFIHLNPLQECIQMEGTPFFKGGLKAIERLVNTLEVPIIIKETGCGFSPTTLSQLNNLGVHAVDVSGYGGTHWGRIEGERALEGSYQQIAAQTFKHWGHSTLDSMLSAATINTDYQTWASGGVRTGLDAAKLIAMGASMVGLAKPLLQASLEGVDAVIKLMNTLEYELKVAMFCTNSKDLPQLRDNKICQ